MIRFWDDTCMKMLPPLEDRSTCSLYHVACILFDPVNKDILKVGYNGSPHGMPHCQDSPKISDGNHHLNCIHAETNALLKAGESARGAWLFCSLTPCRRCAILCVQARISRFYYRDEYRGVDNADIDFVRNYFREAGIELIWWRHQ